MIPTVTKEEKFLDIPKNGLIWCPEIDISMKEVLRGTKNYGYKNN